MHRRALLQLMMAATLAGCGARQPSAKGLKVVVAGAGIVGASIAYHLAKHGAAVTILDAVGPASHASRGTFAWINASWAKQPRHYHGLSQEGVSGWGPLQTELGLDIRKNGSLEWFSSPERNAKLGTQIEEQAHWGEAARMVPAHDVRAWEPEVNFGDVAEVAFSGNDGALDPVAATHALLGAAKMMGAVLKVPCTLTDIHISQNRLTYVETDIGRIAADRLVLATGAASLAPKTFAGIDIPQRSTPGIIAITKPMPPLIKRIIVAPGIHLHQRKDGRIVMGEQEGAPQTQTHAMRLEGRPNEFPSREFAMMHGARMLGAAIKFVPAMQNADIDDVYIGWRPLPLDGHPVLGASSVYRDVYLAIMHSGVTLAPIAGQLATHELINGSAVDRLEAFRPDRDFNKIVRY